MSANTHLLVTPSPITAGLARSSEGGLCRWFAVYTATRHEKSVAQQCRTRQIDFFLPLYRTVHRWKNRRTVPLELPLFANYVFVHIPWGERVRVLEIHGVIRIVGRGREPSPLPDFEIESLRAGLNRRKIEPHPYLIVGERARIIRGALAGMEGVLLRKKNNFRVVLTIAQIMQSVAVEVDVEDLEPVRPAPFIPPYLNSYAYCESMNKTTSRAIPPAKVTSNINVA